MADDGDGGGDSGSDGGGFGGSDGGFGGSDGGFGGSDGGFGGDSSGGSDGFGGSAGSDGLNGSSDSGLGGSSDSSSGGFSGSSDSGLGGSSDSSSGGFSGSSDSSSDGFDSSSDSSLGVSSSDSSSGSAGFGDGVSADANGMSGLGSSDGLGDLSTAGSSDPAATVGDQPATDGQTSSPAPSVSDDLAGADTDGFTVSTSALGDVNTTMGGLVSDGQGLLSGMSSLNLDSSVFGGIGSPVASAAQDLSGGQLSALNSTFGLLGSVNDNIALSNTSYQDADQQVSASLGGPTESATSPYGSLPDSSIFSTTSGLPTFANPTPDQAAALNTLNAQDLATPSLPTFANPTPDEADALNTLNAQAQTTTPANLADDQAMQDQLIAHEAAKTHVYTDTAGHPTVGIGFNLDRSGARDALSAVGADYDAVRAGTQDLTQAQITQLAHTDTQHAVDVARNYYSGFDSLDPARQRALVDMSFNLDNKINQFTGLHQALVNGDYNAAADHIANSLFARQTGVRGTDLTNQMRNGGQ